MEVFAGVITFILVLGFCFLFGLMWWKIFSKAGYHGALGLLMLVPLANIIMLAILAFSEWPIHKEKTNLNEGALKPRKSMPASLIVVIVIAVMVAILLVIGLLAAIAIPSFHKNLMKANEAYAEVTAKNISTAIETYNLDKGTYPSGQNELLDSESPYLNRSFDKSTVQGYIYYLDLSPERYKVLAVPESCNVSGSKNFEVTTGGELNWKYCGQ